MTPAEHSAESVRPTDKYGRPIYGVNEVPPATAEFALWRGKLTHPGAVVTDRKRHRCIGGWVESGEWWLHCGVCRPALIDGSSAGVSAFNAAELQRPGLTGRPARFDGYLAHSEPETTNND